MRLQEARLYPRHCGGISCRLVIPVSDRLRAGMGCIYSYAPLADIIAIFAPVYCCCFKYLTTYYKTNDTSGSDKKSGAVIPGRTCHVLQPVVVVAVATKGYLIFLAFNSSFFVLFYCDDDTQPAFLVPPKRFFMS